VTDPEELRSRAASIFERLRTSGVTSENAADDDAVAGAAEAPAAAEPAGEERAPTTETELGAPPDEADGVAMTPSSPAIVTTDEGPAEPADDGDQAFVLPGAQALGPLAAPTTPRTPYSLPDSATGDEPESLMAEDGEAHTNGRARRALPRILAIANQKGGVGKTTTAVNLGAALAELGYRVLVVDLDPQGNATTGLGINARNLDASVYDVLLHDVPVVDCIEPSSLRNLFVVPATIDLAGAEIELVPVFSRELRLKRALEQLGDDFDFTLIDCPPSLGLLTVNGLAAAGEVVVPIQCEYYALEGLGQLLRNVNLVQTNLNPRLEVSTIILTMYDARTRLAEQVVTEVRKHFGDRVCRSVVPRTVRLSEAPSFGQPIIVFDSSSRGAIAYRELAKEVSGGSPQRIG
jgi:chromosome partitioning protein